MNDLTRLHKGIKQLAAYGILAGLMLGFILLTTPVQDSGLMIGQEASAETIQSSVQEQRHPLPSTLQTSAEDETSDYFQEIKKLPLGYLIWSQFPVQIYVGSSHFSDASRAQAWTDDVLAAIAEWSPFLPLEITADADQADITIEQVRPKRSSNGRIRSAQATPKVFCNGDRLKHRFKIEISPSQTGQYIKAATRHELGHALGIWGHSNNKEDVLYFSQVSNPPSISQRDINTLKKVYEQPTLLGWPSPLCDAASESSTDTS